MSSVCSSVSLDLYGQTYMHTAKASEYIKKELAISGLMESDVIRSVCLDIYSNIVVLFQFAQHDM